MNDESRIAVLESKLEDIGKDTSQIWRSGVVFKSRCSKKLFNPSMGVAEFSFWSDNRDSLFCNQKRVAEIKLHNNHEKKS